jgi:hypothetical protein
MSDVVWSVNFLIAIGLFGTTCIIYKILYIAHQENVSIQNQENKSHH